MLSIVVLVELLVGVNETMKVCVPLGAIVNGNVAPVTVNGPLAGVSVTLFTLTVEVPLLVSVTVWVVACPIGALLKVRLAGEIVSVVQETLPASGILPIENGEVLPSPVVIVEVM